MPHEIGFVDDSVELAHYAMLDKIQDLCDGAGWEVLRYDVVSEQRELIMRAPGYVSPDGQIQPYIGFLTYHSVGADYYNIVGATFTGYIPSNTFWSQPGIAGISFPAHNQRIDYWVTVNDRRIALALKVGTPVYVSGYYGFMLPYATPLQFPYPIVCAGMFSGAPATRFSADQTMPYKGNRSNMLMRFVSGSYVQPHVWPWGNTVTDLNYQIRPTGGSYKLFPMVLHDNSGNVYGELDGTYRITGFDNVVENTLTIDGAEYVVIQDWTRTGFNDYYALRLDPND